MLKRIYVHNFRTFVNFEWAPSSACVLVGENGAGKSALFEVLEMLRDVVAEGKTFEDAGFPATRTAWLSEPEQTIEVDVEHGGQSFSYRLGYRSEDKRGSIREELTAGGSILYRALDGKVELFGDEPASPTPRTTIPFFPQASFLSVLQPHPDNDSLVAFRDFCRAIRVIKPDPRRIGGAAVSEARSVERDLSNFADWYRATAPEDPDATDALRKDLRRVLVGFDQLRLVPIAPEVKDLVVRFAFGETKHELGWAKLSDGQRLLVALYGVLRLAFKRARIVALDEIENYVSPSEIQPWLRIVADEAAEKKQQLLVVSHHPEAIDYLAADAVWRMWRDPAAGHTRIERLAPDRDAGETAYDLVKRPPDG